MPGPLSPSVLTRWHAQLESSVALLQTATADMPRLAKVLASRRHFDLVSERDIRSARDHLSAEIAPQLRELIPLAEQALEREEKVVKSLKSKVSLPSLCCEILQAELVLPPTRHISDIGHCHSTSRSQRGKRSSRRCMRRRVCR